jgi:hypothetical protein
VNPRLDFNIEGLLAKDVSISQFFILVRAPNPYPGFA